MSNATKAVTAQEVSRNGAEHGQKTRIAAYLLTEYLEKLGVEVIFGLCGHTVIAFLDALGKSRIRFISTRHEQVAAHAADGYARATGKASVLLTHLGPGLTNAATGVANAALDSIPMVVIAGDVPSHYFGRHPHQEINLHMDGDQFEVYRPFCKRIYRVDSPWALWRKPPEGFAPVRATAYALESRRAAGNSHRTGLISGSRISFRCGLKEFWPSSGRRFRKTALS
jgi:thiamine pyrophosphate-dependent acetolactate synthase large subunit-like protein